MVEGFGGLSQKEDYQFEIKASGWSFNFINKLKLCFCEKNLHSSLDPYMVRLSIASKERVAGGYDQVEKQLQKLWNEGVKDHKDLELTEVATYVETAGLAFYLKESMSDACKAKLTDRNLELYFQQIIYGMIRYGFSPKIN